MKKIFLKLWISNIYHNFTINEINSYAIYNYNYDSKNKTYTNISVHSGPNGELLYYESVMFTNANVDINTFSFNQIVIKGIHCVLNTGILLKSYDIDYHSYALNCESTLRNNKLYCQ